MKTKNEFIEELEQVNEKLLQYKHMEELYEELKASIPKIQADAVRDALKYRPREAYDGDDVIDMAYEYADQLESQAAKGER